MDLLGLGPSPIWTLSVVSVGLALAFAVWDYMVLRKFIRLHVLLLETKIACSALAWMVIGLWVLALIPPSGGFIGAFFFGSTGYLAHARLQPREFSVWTSPYKRLLAVSRSLGCGLLVALAVSQAELVVVSFAMIVSIRHRAATHTAHRSDAEEFEGLRRKILFNYAMLMNKNLPIGPKSLDDNLPKTG